MDYGNLPAYVYWGVKPSDLQILHFVNLIE